MSFFYNLNEKLAALAAKQDARQISEDVKAAAPKSKLAESFDVAEAGYSAKAGRAGKDLGKPGKNFGKIAKSAGERYGSKAAGERVAGAVLNKLRHPKEGIENEGNAFSGAVVKAKADGIQKGEKIKVGGKTYPVKEADVVGLGEDEKMAEGVSRKHFQAIADTLRHIEDMEKRKELAQHHASAFKLANPRFDQARFFKAAGIDEGNAFTGKLKSTPKGGKFKMGNKTMTDTSEVDEGYAEMDAWMASRKKEKGTGKFDKKERTLPSGMKATTYTRKHEDDEEDRDDSKDKQADKYASPKKKGRPKSAAPKDAERVTKGSHKYKTVNGKRVEKEKTDENLDSDGVLMTRPTNCSNESFSPETEKILRHQQTISKLVDLINNSGDLIDPKLQRKLGLLLRELLRGDIDEEKVEAGKREFFDKLAPAAKKAAKVIKAMSRGRTAVEEESTDKEDTKAEKAGKKVAKDIEHNEGNKAKDDNKAEKAGKKVTKDIEYDDKKDKKEKRTNKEEKVKEGTKGGYSFGGGVYEGFNSKIENMITEGMNVSVNMSTGDDGQPTKSINISADGEDADKLAELLKMAGLDSQTGEHEVCSTCGESACGCDQEVVDENSPDWPTNTETLAAQPELRTYSGGLNGPKSTGQTTIPVVASQLRRQASMEESVKLERSLFKTWKDYKG